MGRRARAGNPLSGVIGWFLSALLLLAGVTAAYGRDWPFSRYLFAATFIAGGCVGAVWTLFAVRAGRLSIVSPNTGSVFPVERRKEPLLFFFVAVIYFAVAVGAGWLGLLFLLS